jgi:hypothetical protein
MADAKNLAPGPQYARPGSPAGARQKVVAREYPQRAREVDRMLRTPEGVDESITREMKYCSSRVPVPVVGTSAEMSSDVDELARNEATRAEAAWQLSERHVVYRR